MRASVFTINYDRASGYVKRVSYQVRRVYMIPNGEVRKAQRFIYWLFQLRWWKSRVSFSTIIIYLG